MKKRRISSRLKAEMNLIPLIDVSFVLLILFMIVSPSISNSIKIDLPKVTSQTVNQVVSNQWIISINKDKKLFLDRGNNKVQSNRSFTINEIKALVTTKLKQNSTLKIFIRGDKAVAYGEVIKVMSVLQNSGIKDVGLVTERE